MLSPSLTASPSLPGCLSLFADLVCLACRRTGQLAPSQVHPSTKGQFPRPRPSPSANGRKICGKATRGTRRLPGPGTTPSTTPRTIRQGSLSEMISQCRQNSSKLTYALSISRARQVFTQGGTSFWWRGQGGREASAAEQHRMRTSWTSRAHAKLSCLNGSSVSCKHFARFGRRARTALGGHKGGPAGSPKDQRLLEAKAALELALETADEEKIAPAAPRSAASNERAQQRVTTTTPT